jgi:uracil-DNA glycosylase
MRTKCKCGLFEVDPTGPMNASILIVTDGPSYDDIRSGKLMSGRDGDILRKELAISGIQLSSCRVISLHPHGKSKECDVDHVSGVTNELQGHDWVILMGSEISQMLIGHSLMEITGLKVKSKLFPKIKFFGMPHPSSMFHGDVGEMRLALQKFTEKRSKK